MVAVSVVGTKAWVTPAGADKIHRLRAPSGVLLLPGFDPYTIAPISARAYTIPDGFVDRVSRTAGWISPGLLVDGVVAGTWSLNQRGNSVVIELEPFTKVSAETKKAAATYAHRYGRILDSEVEVRWTV
jgi:DNA glycosylase AlkZ-like